MVDGFHKAMDRLFDDFWQGNGCLPSLLDTWAGDSYPNVDQTEDEKHYYRSERSFGAFRRVLSFPGALDDAKIQASFKKGVLSVVLPKTKEAREKVRKIPVKSDK